MKRGEQLALRDKPVAAGRPGQAMSEIVIQAPHRGVSEQRVAEWRRRRDRSLAVALPVALLLSWEVLGLAGMIDIRFFPPPSRILVRWGDMIANGTYWAHLLTSLFRILTGFLTGGLSGLVAGFVLGQLPSVRRVFEPLIIGFYTIPKLSILPLLLLIFGIGEETKVLMVGLSVVFVVLINTMAAVASVPSGYLDAARSFEASRWETTRYVLLPAALPQVFVGLRLGWGMAVITIVGAEFVAAKTGIGFLVWNSWNLGIPQGMYIGILTISMVGVAGNALINLAQGIIAPWSRTTR